MPVDSLELLMTEIKQTMEEIKRREDTTQNRLAQNQAQAEQWIDEVGIPAFENLQTSFQSGDRRLTVGKIMGPEFKTLMVDVHHESKTEITYRVKVRGTLEGIVAERVCWKVEDSNRAPSPEVDVSDLIQDNSALPVMRDFWDAYKQSL